MIPLPTPWLVGIFYVVGIVVAGYLHLKAARIGGGQLAVSQPNDHRISSGDAFADFSIAANSSGSWLYGWSKNILGGQFVPHTRNQVNSLPGVDTWDSPGIPHMCVAHNRNGRVLHGNPNTYTIPSDMLLMHPGEGGIYDVVRWTCPQSGRYRIQGLFIGLDFNIDVADSDVDVIVGSTSLYRSKAPAIKRVLQGAGSHVPIEFTDIPLKAGDAVDFVVGVGPSGSHGSDSTGLEAKITRQSR